MFQCTISNDTPGQVARPATAPAVPPAPAPAVAPTEASAAQTPPAGGEGTAGVGPDAIVGGTAAAAAASGETGGDGAEGSGVRVGDAVEELDERVATDGVFGEKFDVPCVCS